MKKLLLPIDGTKLSLQTIDWVLNNYNAKEVSVTLMMVADSMDVFEMKDKATSAQDYMMRTMKHDAQALINNGFDVSFDTEYGQAGDQIVKYAKKEAFDAIIMTKSTKEGWFSTIGSVTANVVKYASTLVMIIPETK